MKMRRLMAAVFLLCLLLVGCDSAPQAVSPGADGSADVENDLTQMSGNMVYGYVFAMLNEPETHLGQSFRLRGTYDRMVDEAAGQTYHFIFIADAAACCAEGMEFVLIDEDAAYPTLGAQIEITGIYSSYEDEGLNYLRIEADSLTEV
jgi:hypothetical protein